MTELDPMFWAGCLVTLGTCGACCGVTWLVAYAAGRRDERRANCERLRALMAAAERRARDFARRSEPSRK